MSNNSKVNEYELKLTSDSSQVISEMLKLAEAAEKTEKEVKDLGKSLDEVGKRTISITPKINFELDAKSAKVVESAAKQIQGTIDKAFKKYKVSATLALPKAITSSSQIKKLNDLMTDAKNLGYTGQALDAIELKYQEIIKTVAALNAETKSLKDSLSSLKTEQDVINYFDRINKHYNSRKKLGELNSELPRNLRLTDSYKSFGELAELPEFERYANRHKKMVTDAIYINTGFVDSINQIVAAGKEIKTVDLSSIVSNIQLTEFGKLLGKARQEIGKYAVDTETALKKLKNLTTRYEHDKLSDQGAKDIAGYYTSYIKQGNAPQKKIENIVKDLSTYSISPGDEGYSKVEHTKAQKVLAIQEAVKEGITEQFVEQKKLNAETEKTVAIEQQIETAQKAHLTSLSAQELNAKSFNEKLALLKDMKKAASMWYQESKKDDGGEWLDRVNSNIKVNDTIYPSLEAVYAMRKVIVDYADGTQGIFDQVFNPEANTGYDMFEANEQFRKQIDLRKKIIDITFEEISAQEALNASNQRFKEFTQKQTKELGLTQGLSTATKISFDTNQRKEQSKIFEAATSETMVLGMPKELEKLWISLDEAIGSGTLSGQKAIDTYNAKAQELGVTFDEASRKWVKLTSTITSTPIPVKQETKAIEQAHARMMAEQREWNRASINRTLTGLYPGNSSVESTRTVLSQLKEAHEAYDLSIKNNWDWESQYQWAVKFTSLYEQYAGRDNGTAKSLAKHTELYNQLLPYIETYKTDLQAVLDFKPSTPLPVAEAQNKVAEATEKATAVIERQQKIAANAPIASVKSDNATIYQNAWKDVISNQAKNLAVSDKTLTDANALLQSAQSSLRSHAKIAKETYKQVLKEQIRNTPKQKGSAFKIPSSGYVVNQTGDVDQEESSWRYLLQLNNFQKQTIANVSDKDGNWQEVESKVFTNFKKLSADIIECDTAILKLNNDYNNLGKTKTGQHQNGQPLLDEIEAKIEERDRLVKMAKKVGSDPVYAADYRQFVKDRQDNSAQVKRDLAIANSKQDAKIASNLPKLELQDKLLKQKIKNENIGLDKLKQDLKESGQLTQSAIEKIKQLELSLQKVNSNTGLSLWKEQLKEFKATASNLPKTFQESWDQTLVKINTGQAKALSAPLAGVINRRLGIGEKSGFTGTEWTGALADESKNVLNRYNEIMATIKEITTLSKQLNQIQGKSFKDPFTDYSQNIQFLKTQIDDLSKSLHDLLKNNFINANSDILGKDRINNFNTAMNTMDVSIKHTDSDLIKRMQNSLVALYQAELKVMNISKQGLLDTTHLTKATEEAQKCREAYNGLAQQVTQVYGHDVKAAAIANINSSYFDSFEKILVGESSKYVKQLNVFGEKLGTGFLSNVLKSDMQATAKNIVSITAEFESGARAATKFGDALSTINASSNLNKVANIFNSKMSFWKDTWGKFGGIEKQLTDLGSFAQLERYSEAYNMKLQEMQQRFQHVITGMFTGDIPYDEGLEHLSVMNSQLQAFKLTKDQFLKETSAGVFDESSFGKIHNIADDATAALRSYGKQLGNFKAYGDIIPEAGNKISQVFEDQEHRLYKLTATWDETNKAIRIGKQEFVGYSNFLGDWGNAFSGFAKQMMSYYTGYQLFTRVMRQAREGLNVLKQYDAAITDMSYSMDVSERQLAVLGDSAVEMAKDLSTSLEDTLGIYQIYANMNTSIQEIEDTAKPTAILSNLGGIDALEASDQIQGVLQQFNMIEEGGENAAAASMHVVDVFDNIASNVSIDYVKGMKTISEAVTATGSVAYDAGMSFEQLAAVTAKVAERTREDGSTIGNAIKTIVTRISKVGKMPAYADEVSNEELSKASEALNEIGIAVYNTDGSFRELDVILTELRDKWDGLTDAQQANLSFQIAA